MARVAGGARVGLNAIENHTLRTDQAVEATAFDIQKWIDDTTAIARARPDTAQCFPGGPLDGCLTDAEKAVNNFAMGTWNPFYKRWKAYAKSTDFIGDEAEVIKYDNELDDNRALFSKLSADTPAGDTLKTAIPAPQVTPEGGSMNPLSGLASTIKDVVLVAGLGLILFVGGFYILPALFGAASATKRAARTLKEA